MSRYLVANPEAGVDPATSTFVSGWIQLPDREAGANYAPLSPPEDGWVKRAAWMSTRRESSDPLPDLYTEWAEGDAALIMGAEGTASTPPPSELRPVEAVAFWGSYFTGAGGLGNPYVETRRAAKTVHGGADAWGNAEHLAPGRSKWRDAWREEDWPEDSIGYEVELAEVSPGVWAPLSEPLYATVTGLAEGFTSRGLVGGLELHVQAQRVWKTSGTLLIVDDPEYGWIATASTGAVAMDPWRIEETYQEPIASLIFDIPMGGASLETPFEMVISTFDSELPYLGLFSMWSSLRNGMIVSGESILAKAGAAVSVMYTMRPPRFRWIYESERPATGAIEGTRVRFV